jgi:hypothetical protein
VTPELAASAEQVTNDNFSKESMNGNDHSTATEQADNCSTCDTLTRRAFVKGAGATAAIAATGAGGAAAQDTTTEEPDWQSGRGGLNWDSDYVPDPYFAATLEKAKHRATWGTDDAALMAYENDNGNRDDLGGDVDREDSENVLTFSADALEFPDASAFPRSTQYDADGDGDKEEDVTALDPTHWSTTGATNGSVSVSEPNLDVSPALEVSTSSVASGETVKATLDLSQFGAEVTEDAAKRYAQAVANTVSLESAARVEIAFIDGDGDEKVLVIDSSADGSSADVVATATGNGQSVQQRFGDLSTVANGDGDWNGVVTVEVRVMDANATVQFTAFSAEKMSRWVFGSYLQNEDTDDETRVKRYEPSGTVTATGLDTFSDALQHEDAVYYGLEYPVEVPMEESDLDYEFRFKEATDRVGYDSVLEARGKARLTKEFDLNWKSPALKEDVRIPGERFVSVETASGVEDVAFEDIDDSSWTAHGSKYDSKGTTVSLADPAQHGVVYAHKSEILLTESNREEVADSSGETSGEGSMPAPEANSKSTPWGAVAAVGTGALAFVTGLFRGWF